MSARHGRFRAHDHDALASAEHGMTVLARGRRPGPPRRAGPSVEGDDPTRARRDDDAADDGQPT